MATETDGMHLVRVPIDEIQIGDVVWHYGMRIVIDREAHTYPGDTRDKDGNLLLVYSFLGLVTNVDDVKADGRIPIDWLYHHDRSGKVSDEARWNVQSNNLATWAVQRSAGEGDGV